MPGVKAILPTLRRRLSTGDIFKPARKLVKLSLHIRKDFITRVASKNVWVILAPSNGLIAIMNWFQKVSLNEMSGKVLTSLGGSNYIAYNSVGKYSSKFAYPFISVVLGYRLEWYNQLFSLTLQHPAVLLPVFGRGKAGVFLKGPAEMGKVVKADFLNDLRD